MHRGSAYHLLFPWGLLPRQWGRRRRRRLHDDSGDSHGSRGFSRAFGFGFGTRSGGLPFLVRLGRQLFHELWLLRLMDRVINRRRLVLPLVGSDRHLSVLLAAGGMGPRGRSPPSTFTRNRALCRPSPAAGSRERGRQWAARGRPTYYIKVSISSARVVCGPATGVCPSV